MPVGQFKTRRGEGGRIEKIPEAEQGELRAEAAGAPPLPAAPPPLPPESDFIKQFREEGAPGAEPPPVPPAPPVKAPDPGVQAAKGAQQGASTGAGIGATIGSIVPGVGTAVGAAAGAVVGGAGGLIASTARDKPIGSLTGGQATTQDEGPALLRKLLAVQQTIARAGAPIKGAVKTKATDSRM